VALRAADIELSGLLSGFSATRSYAGAPMLRTARFTSEKAREGNAVAS
jgi:hypothetical protein